MRYTWFRTSRLALAAGTVLLGACTVSDASDNADSTRAAAAAAAAAPATTPAPATASIPPGMTADSAAAAGGTATPPQALSTMRVEVDVKARRLHLYEGDQRVSTHPVAVGSTKWPTQTGEWTIKQVVFNPEWVPPDESWAEEREPRKSGDPKNPLGRAQLVYDLPRTIHGTNQPSSVGQAVSHGSIRMTNADVVTLARRIMEANGAGKDEAWYRRAAEQRTDKQVVDLPTPVPIRVF